MMPLVSHVASKHEVAAWTAGKYNMLEGGDCTDCAEGKYSSSGETSCTICQAGKITASTGSSSCSSCPSGKVSNADFTECVCAPGSQPDSSDGCEECAAGKASATASSDACESCRPGTYAESTGLSSCSDCAAGKYMRSSGATSCSDCPSELTSRSDFQDCACSLGHGIVAPTGQLAAGTSIRLNVGTSSFEGPSFDDQGQVTGRLEYKLFGWGTVGDKDTNTYRFGEKEAQVACRQLGLETGYDVLLNSSFVPSSETSNGYLNPLLDDLSCDPADSSLASCLNGAESTNAGTSNSYDIGVTCKFAECESCKHGAYSDTLENKECQICVAGAYNPKNVSTTKSDCLKCSSESYSSPGSIECSSCPAELVQAEDGGSCACDLGRQPALATPTGSLQYSSESTIRLSQSSSSVQAPSFSSDGTIYGRLEIRNPSSADGEWGTVSGIYTHYDSSSGRWGHSSSLPNIATAVVACKQLAKELGYYSDPLSAEVLHFEDDRVIEGYLDPVLTKMECVTTLSAIGGCSYSSDADKVPEENYFDVGLQCKFWAASESNTCEACVAGKVSSGATNELCTDCPKNHYNPSYGATSCDECQAFGILDMFGPEGSPSDSMCFSGPGLWSNLYITDNAFYKIDDDGETFSTDGHGNWGSISVSFVSRDIFLALDNQGCVYEYSSESMARIGTFATISNYLDDTAVLYLDQQGLVAVGAQDGIYFFALEDGLGGRNLGESSYDRFIDLEDPKQFCLGEFENELLILTEIGSADKITRKCAPGTNCSSEREGVVVYDASGSYDFYDVAVLKEMGVILVTVSSNLIYSVRSCPLSGSAMDIDTDCRATQIAFKPHVVYQGSEIKPPASDSKAGSVTEFPLDLYDNRNKALSDEFDFAYLSSKVTVRAEGYVQVADGLNAKIDIDGDVEHSGTSMTAKLGINFAGVWQVHVSGESNGVPIEFMNSPFDLTVEPDDTDASKTEVDFPSEIVAGNKLEGRFKLYDTYRNPTSFSVDRLFNELIGYPSNLGGTFVKSNGAWEYSTSQNLTKAGPYTLKVTLGDDEHIIGSPFQFDVVADDPVPSNCGSNVKDMDKELFSSGSTFTGAMVLKAIPRDQYRNLVLNTVGFEAHVRLISGGIPGEAIIVALDAADQYETEVPIAEESETV
ncbi:hypothetical protein TL16_g13267, partial [Triparma laevis f. inornata]